MSSGHVDTTIKTAVQNNTVFDAVLDATAIYNWRNEIAAKIDGNYDDAQSKAPLASPAFTGTPTVPTPAVDTNTTQAASAAFVLAQAASASPLMDGAVAVGTSTRFARADHIHASDTSRAPLASPVFTGNPAVPTQATSDNSTKAANTAFVKSLTNLSGSGSPIGVTTPTVVGQHYTDINSGLVYTATALTNTSWIVVPMISSMSQQAIINAAMEIWQQGTSFTNPANNAYTADMWVLNNVNSGTLPTTIIHSQAALTAGELFNSKYAYNINVNGAGSGFGINDIYGAKQRIEFGASKLCGNGKKVTISFYAKSNIAGKRIAVSVSQYYGTGGSPSATDICAPTATSIRTLTTSMALYTFTFTTATLTGKTFGTNNDEQLIVNISTMWGSNTATGSFGGGTAETFVGAGDVSFTEVVVNAGDVALPFQPKSFNDELFACFRYFEKSYSYPTAPLSITTAGMDIKILPSNTIVTNQIYGKVTYKTVKRVVPVVTIYPYTTPTNTGRVSDANLTDLAANSGVITTPGDSSFGVVNTGGTITTVNNTILFHWTSDARL